MIIFNHPVFPSQFSVFSRPRLSISAMRQAHPTATSARKRCLIKPNKTEVPGCAKTKLSIAEKATVCPMLPIGICRDSFPNATNRRNEK